MAYIVTMKHAWAVALLMALTVSTTSAANPPGPTLHPLLSNILSTTRESHDWIVGIRRQLHAIPELGSQEVKTSALIRKVLDELGIPHKDVHAKAGTGIVATISSGTPGPTVALRADIDALPIQEPEGLSYISTHPGVMHACGHDGHTSMLLGAAKALKSLQGQLPSGDIRLIFQPNEEFGAGGEHLIAAGVLDGVSAVFGVHVAPWIPSGLLGVRSGTIMAGALSFHVTVMGRGGHAAMPHLNVDPVVAAAAIISQLQTLVSRETSPLGSAVLSVTLVNAGHAYNVIPDTAEFGGTIRALSHDVIVVLSDRLESLAKGVAAGMGCNVTVDWRLNEQPYYVPTVNDAATVQFVRHVAESVIGVDNVIDAEPIMAAEDFAFYCRKAPCNFGFLGIRNESVGSVWALHNPHFKMDEWALHKGAALHASFAIQHLAAAQQEKQQQTHQEL